MNPVTEESQLPIIAQTVSNFTSAPCPRLVKYPKLENFFSCTSYANQGYGKKAVEYRLPRRPDSTKKPKDSLVSQSAMTKSIKKVVVHTRRNHEGPNVD
jgi:hypothetical protein